MQSPHPSPVRSTLSGIVAVFFVLRLSAQAQSPSPSPSPSPADQAERVVMADPYYATAESYSAVRVTVITAELMTKEGANTPIEALRQIPFFVGTTRTENNSMGGDGSASINLYALGSNNVLPLINGRRAVGFSNINAIPISALARTEILDGGFYGSDSTAGAVNFILLNGPGEAPYEGAELQAVYGNTTDDDAHVRQVYLRGGVTGLDGKVSIAAAAEYYSRANLFSRDREISRSGDLSNDATGLGLGGPNNNSPTFAGRVSIFAGPIVFPVTGQLVLRNPSENQVTPASYRPFDVPAGTDPARFNFRAFTPAIPAVEKAMYFVTGRYKIFGDDMQFYGDVMYSKTQQDNGLAAAPFTLSTAGNGRNEARASAYNPFGNQLGSVRYRLVNDLGMRRSFYDHDYWRYVVGINGDFDFKENSFISRFGYDAGYVYERFDEDRVESGDARRDYIRALIAPAGYVIGFGVPPLGQPPTGTFNPFIGQNAPLIGNAPTYINGVPTGLTASYDNTIASRLFTDGGAAYIAHSLFFERDYLYDAKINAHLFPNLWNGGVDLAAGYEHRQTQATSIPDPVQLSNQQFGFNPAPRSKFLQEVDSVFAELNVPLVTSTMNVPFVRSLDVSAAFRSEKFDDRNRFTHATARFNNNGAPQLALRYQPTPDLMLRASWRQSIRTPTFDELFAPVVQTFPLFFGTGISIQPPEGIFIGGNPTLKPEKTDAYSAGIVWTPRFISGFTITMDWYQLFTRDVILDGNYLWPLATKLTTPFVDPDGCGGGSGVPGFPGGPGVGITRSRDGTVECIDSLNTNAGKRLVQGIDVTAVYEIPTERFGKFTIAGGYNHFFTWKAEPVAGTGGHSFLGTYNNGSLPLVPFAVPGSLPFGPGAVPYNKGFLRGEWEWRGFDFIATGNYIGDFEDDPSFIAGNTQLKGTLSSPAFALHRRVPSYTTLDLQLSYEWKKPETDWAPADAKSPQRDASTATIWQRLLWGTRLSVGVNNAFDRNPPTVLGALNDNYDTSLYSIRNRYCYIAIAKKF